MRFSTSGGPSGKGGQNRENPTRSGDITCMFTTWVTNPKSAAVDLRLSETLKSTRTCFGQSNHCFGELVPDLWSIRTYPGMEMSQAKITATETDYK